MHQYTQTTKSPNAKNCKLNDNQFDWNRLQARWNQRIFGQVQSGRFKGIKANGR